MSHQFKEIVLTNLSNFPNHKTSTDKSYLNKKKKLILLKMHST